MSKYPDDNATMKTPAPQLAYTVVITAALIVAFIYGLAIVYGPTPSYCLPRDNETRRLVVFQNCLSRVQAPGERIRGSRFQNE